MKKINLLSGVLAVIGATLFIGGLAWSIYDNTEDIAFPIIAILVLLMVYKGAYDEIRSGPDHT